MLILEHLKALQHVSIII